MNAQSTYQYIVSVVREENTKLEEAMAAGNVYEVARGVVRLRAKISKEQLLQALTDQEADAADAECIKDALWVLYQYQLPSQ